MAELTFEVEEFGIVKEWIGLLRVIRQLQSAPNVRTVSSSRRKGRSPRTKQEFFDGGFFYFHRKLSRQRRGTLVRGTGMVCAPMLIHHNCLFWTRRVPPAHMPAATTLIPEHQFQHLARASFVPQITSQCSNSFINILHLYPPLFCREPAIPDRRIPALLQTTSANCSG